MPRPVVPNQFEVGKNKIVHKPTKAIFGFDPGDNDFKSVNWGRAGEQPADGGGLPARRCHTGCKAAAREVAQIGRRFSAADRVRRGERDGFRCTPPVPHIINSG